MSKVEMRVPTIGESITEVTLSSYLKENGSFVKLDEPICEFESDKATLEFPAEAEGVIEWVAKEDDDLEIGALVAIIDTAASAQDNGASESPKKEEEIKTSSAAIESDKKVDHASPAAAKILAEKGVDQGSVTGTGRDGRITKEDAIKASAPVAKVSDHKEEEVTPSPSPSLLFSRNENSEKMSRMRRTIAKRLVSAKNNTAMLTTFNEVDLTNVMKMRKQYQEQFVEKYGIKLGFMSIFGKACAKVLMDMPAVNAKLDGDHLVTHDYVDISIAISTPNGLVVPPIRNAESLGFHEFEKQLSALAKKAREGNLSLEEMSGGTFTITNGGVFGSLVSTPIINEPQSAILGMHTIQQRPVAVNGEVQIRPMMYLALSYDHRVIDGSSSVTFLVKVKQLLEDPLKLLLAL